MRISSKGRYGMAAVIYMALNGNENECITINRIASQLGISKIYLEQVFSLLKKSGLVLSIKGAQGGYKLAKPAEDISAFDVLYSVESSLFETAEKSVELSAPETESTMQELIFRQLDEAIAGTLQKISIDAIVLDILKKKKAGDFMFYI
jgi:Rrf2 family protein